MQQFEGNNIGSLATLEICFQSDIESYNPIVLKTGKSWLNIPFDEETANLEDSIEETEQGNVYSYTGGFKLHRQRSEVNTALMPYIGKRSVIRVTDMNGETYILGAPGLPCTLKSNATTGQKFNSENSRSFSFSVQMPNIALSQ